MICHRFYKLTSYKFFRPEQGRAPYVFGPLMRPGPRSTFDLPDLSFRPWSFSSIKS